MTDKELSEYIYAVFLAGKQSVINKDIAKESVDYLQWLSEEATDSFS